MVPMVHLLESQGRDRLLDGDANGTRVLQVGLWIVKLKLSECVSVRWLHSRPSKERYELLVRLVK